MNSVDANLRVNPSEAKDDLYNRIFRKLRETPGRLSFPSTAEALIALMSDIALPNEKIVITLEFKELAEYWYAHGTTTPENFFTAPVNLIAAHNVLRYFASSAQDDIASLRNSLNIIERTKANELQAWGEIQEAEKCLENARNQLQLNRSELHVFGAPSGGARLKHPDPAIENSHKVSWQGRVEDTVMLAGYYKALLADESHAANNFESWATRYLFRNTSIRCDHISNRSIFPTPWKLLTALLDECFVARQSQAVRTTIERLCAKSRR